MYIYVFIGNICIWIRGRCCYVGGFEVLGFLCDMLVLYFFIMLFVFYSLVYFYDEKVRFDDVK